jgi:cystathionine gamma-synthase
MLNPAGRHYIQLKEQLDSVFEDTYFGPDALVMERNSRGLAARIPAIDMNAEAMADWLLPRTRVGGYSNSVVKEIFYPKWTNRVEYDAVRRRRHSASKGESPYAGGFGGLFSLTFTSLAASKAFYDALACYKGPSLGTRFTLACPYTIIAHYREMEWAAEFGVEEGIVRLSVGCEDRERLMKALEVAFNAAQANANGVEEDKKSVAHQALKTKTEDVKTLPAPDVHDMEQLRRLDTKRERLMDSIRKER